MSNKGCDPAKLLPMTKEEKRAYVIEVVTHLAQFENNPLSSNFTFAWKEFVQEGVEQMWQFLEDFIKREGLS